MMILPSSSSRKRRLVSRFSLFACYNLVLTPCRSWVLNPSIGNRQATAIRNTLSQPTTLFSADYEYEEDKYDDTEAKSQFGTKEYWDETYQGRGDFPMDEYQWYFGFEEYGKFFEEHVKSKDSELLIPGIGNDPILLDLLQKGYTRLTATDYSEFAIERQQDLLGYQQYPFVTDLDELDKDDEEPPTLLMQMDARKMPSKWADKFDTIVEKGALDAIYLSGDGNVELAAKEFERVVKPGGILISVSGVVPTELRKEIFQHWKWIRDGSEDLSAGCFILEKPKS